MAGKNMSEPFVGDYRSVDLGDGAVLHAILAGQEQLDQLSPLLMDAFGDDRFNNRAYLEWFYMNSPFGQAITFTTEKDGDTINHLAAAPRRLKTTGGYLDMWLVANIGSRPGFHGKGYFMKLCLAAWMLTIEYKAMGIYGVMNDKSVKALRSFGVVTEAELTAKVLAPGPFKPGVWTHHTVTPEFLASPEFVEIMADTDLPPRRGVRHWWDIETLTWRLSCPLNTYTIHSHDDLVAISTKVKVKGIPVVILLKVFARGHRRKKMDVRKTWFSPTAVGAVCAHHKSPFAIYVGMNSDVRVMGATIPQQYLPSPLHLCFKVDGRQIATEDLRFDTFELLDFDVL